MAEYISRDAARHTIIGLEMRDCTGCERYKRGFGDDYCFNEGLLAASSAISELPAADVIEVRHGRWVAESYYAGPIKMWGWKCTACGAFSYVDYKFCPSCMARMDESEDEERAYL